MIVVSDTFPLMNLAVVGKLDIPQRPFGIVVIPYAVLDCPVRKKSGWRRGLK